MSCWKRTACVVGIWAVMASVLGCRNSDVAGRSALWKGPARIPADDEPAPPLANRQNSGSSTAVAAPAFEPGVRPASHVSRRSPGSLQAPLPPPDDADEPRVDAAQVEEVEEVVEVGAEPNALDVAALVADVLARHPDIRSAQAAWRAAAERYPQEISLDDPMFGFMLGPDSWGDDEFDSAYQIETAQTIPWPGKRRLRGEVARAEANRAYFDIGAERLQIAETARRAYYQYFLAHRQLAVLDESAQLLEGFRTIALRKFESAESEQQDVLLADVELAELQQQRLALIRAERVARARINTLLLVPPSSPLRPPPAGLRVDGELPPSDELFARALAQRPELAARAAQVRRERFAAGLAQLDFYPDLTFAAEYNAFMPEEALRTMVGMNLNVPLYKQKRWAAVREAGARVTQQQALYDAETVRLAFDVEQTYQQVEESRQALAIYEEKLLPTTRHSVEAAQASYVAGRLDFLRLIEAQRQLLSVQDRYFTATAEYFTRRAELDRVVGQW